MSGPPLTVAMWLSAAAPIVVLFASVLSGRLSARAAAGVVLVLAGAIGVFVYHADAVVLGAALGKGLWLGTWILGVVWPALLLYGVASSVGLERIGHVLASVLPQRRETLLLLAWVFPSFLQGVAGFGTPIAVCAPLLLATGWGPVRSVVYPLIGYHWSVTFGSMGSSFYMAALTAHLGAAEHTHLALLASSLLALQCLVAGALVLWLDGGVTALRQGARMLAVVGVPMAAALVGVAITVPAVASLAAGTVGFLAVVGLSVMDRRRHVPVISGGSAGLDQHDAPAAPSARRSLQVLAPYLFLLITALPVFLIPASRAWVDEHLVVAPSFPATTTGYGWSNVAVDSYTPFAVLGHPGFYVALATLLGFLTYRASGLWRSGAAVVGTWARSLPASSLPILLLAALATVMTDTGMVSVLSLGTARVAGDAYPALAPMIGGLGSFMTGSTTTSNALFSGLQADVARLLDVDPVVLIAAQTVGGNIGNALAPVVALVGLSTVGQSSRLSDVVRRTLPPAALLFGVAAIVTVLRV